MKTIEEELGLDGEDKISDFPKKFNRLLRIVERLIRAISFLLAIDITFLIQAFLSGKLAQIFIFFNIDWNKFSEGYQLLILGIPITIITGVTIHFINKKYIDPLFSKKKN